MNHLLKLPQSKKTKNTCTNIKSKSKAKYQNITSRVKQPGSKWQTNKCSQLPHVAHHCNEKKPVSDKEGAFRF